VLLHNLNSQHNYRMGCFPVLRPPSKALPLFLQAVANLRLRQTRSLRNRSQAVYLILSLKQTQFSADKPSSQLLVAFLPRSQLNRLRCSQDKISKQLLVDFSVCKLLRKLGSSNLDKAYSGNQLPASLLQVCFSNNKRDNNKWQTLTLIFKTLTPLI
jgi:hypothetical protein